MFIRIFNWFKKRREWTKDHKQAWLGLAAVDANGVTEFQKLLLAYLELVFPELEFSREGKSEAYFVATIPNSKIKVFVFPDGAQVIKEKHLLRAEEWDYRTPAEMIDALDSVLRSCWHAT